MDGRHWMHDDGATLTEERESESKKKTHSSLIQTGVSFSLDLKGGRRSMLHDGRCCFMLNGRWLALGNRWSKLSGRRLLVESRLLMVKDTVLRFSVLPLA